MIKFPFINLLLFVSSSSLSFIATAEEPANRHGIYKLYEFVPETSFLKIFSSSVHCSLKKDVIETSVFYDETKTVTYGSINIPLKDYQLLQSSINRLGNIYNNAEVPLETEQRVYNKEIFKLKFPDKLDWTNKYKPEYFYFSFRYSDTKIDPYAWSDFNVYSEQQERDNAGFDLVIIKEFKNPLFSEKEISVLKDIAYRTCEKAIEATLGH